MDKIQISPEFAKALVKAQSGIEGAKKGAENTFFKKNGKASKYADLASCWDACRDALHSNNIAILQPTTKADAGYVGLTTALVYGPTGEVLQESYAMPLKDATNPQAAGSAITYARRYALCSIIGICPDDDDANAAAKTFSKPNEQTTGYKELTDRLLLEFLKADSVPEMKTLYSKAKAEVIAEPYKTQLLSRMADKIKAEQK